MQDKLEKARRYLDGVANTYVVDCEGFEDCRAVVEAMAAVENGLQALKSHGAEAGAIYRKAADKLASRSLDPSLALRIAGRLDGFTWPDDDDCNGYQDHQDAGERPAPGDSGPSLGLSREHAETLFKLAWPAATGGDPELDADGDADQIDEALEALVRYLRADFVVTPPLEWSEGGIGFALRSDASEVVPGSPADDLPAEGVPIIFFGTLDEDAGTVDIRNVDSRGGVRFYFSHAEPGNSVKMPFDDLVELYAALGRHIAWVRDQ